MGAVTPSWNWNGSEVSLDPLNGSAVEVPQDASNPELLSKGDSIWTIEETDSGQAACIATDVVDEPNDV